MSQLAHGVVAQPPNSALEPSGRRFRYRRDELGR
jgi:hypothetical protein